MARRNATFEEVYLAVQTYLQTQLGLGERAVLLRLDADSPPIPIGSGDDGTNLGVAPGSMLYPDYWGDPVNHCTVDADFAVTTTQRIWLDDANQDAAALTDATRGLLIIQRKVIKAMVSIGAELTLEGGDTFLHDSMRPIGSARPSQGTLVGPDGEDEGVPVYFQTINFVGRFDLDLTSE